MKNLLILIVVLSILSLALPVAAGDDSVVRLSEPVVSTADYEDFGSALAEAGPALSLAEAVAAAPEHQDQAVLITTTVAQVCQKKGCFFIAQDGAVAARITFKDYAFFIPTDSARKRVTLLGTVARVPLSASQAGHLAEDLGGDAANAAPGYENLIVAEAIRIPKSPGS